MVQFIRLIRSRSAHGPLAARKNALWLYLNASVLDLNRVLNMIATFVTPVERQCRIFGRFLYDETVTVSVL